MASNASQIVVVLLNRTLTSLKSGGVITHKTSNMSYILDNSKNVLSRIMTSFSVERHIQHMSVGGGKLAIWL